MVLVRVRQGRAGNLSALFCCFLLAKISNQIHKTIMKRYPKHGSKVYFRLICIVFVLLVVIGSSTYGFAQNTRLIIEQAVVCEAIQDFQPFNPGISFSIENGSITCFTRFDAISNDTFVEHRWYRKDNLVTEQKLALKAPRWSTYSRIQLREFDMGPWRVEIVDSNDQVLATIRFSVTE